MGWRFESLSPGMRVLYQARTHDGQWEAERALLVHTINDEEDRRKRQAEDEQRSSAPRGVSSPSSEAVFQSRFDSLSFGPRYIH